MDKGMNKKMNDELDFSNLILSNDEKDIIKSLYKRSKIHRMDGDRQEILQLPCLDIPDAFVYRIGNDTKISLMTEDRSMFYSLLTLSSLALGSRTVVETAMAQSQSDDGKYIILKRYRTKVNIDIDSTIRYIQNLSGKAKNPSTKSKLKKRFLRCLRNGIESLSSQRYLDDVPVLEVKYGNPDEGACTLIFHTKFVNQVYAELVNEILENSDKSTQVTTLMNLVSVFYGFCTEMINEKSSKTIKKDTELTKLDILNIENESGLKPDPKKVIVDSFDKEIGKGYKISVRLHHRQGAWRKQKVIANRLGIENDAMKNYIKRLREMDILRSIVLYSPAGQKSMAVDMVRYNSDYALTDFLSKRSVNYFAYRSIRSVWWEGKEIINRNFDSSLGLMESQNEAA